MSSEAISRNGLARHCPPLAVSTPAALSPAFCVHNGITRGIWRVTGWDPDEARWGVGRRGLKGEPALDLWDEYVGRDASEYLPAQGGRIPYTILP